MSSKSVQRWGTVLITGATDGIGLALAQQYQSQAVRLVLLGRRPWEAVPLSQFPAEVYCQADLSQPDCVTRVSDHLRQRQIDTLDLVIHNAGMGYYGPVADQAWSNIEAILTVNVWSPIALTHRLLPAVKAGSGKIVFISSVVSALPGPDYAVYTASKAALDGFARNLRLELGRHGAVQVIHPGATQTGMHRKSGMSEAEVEAGRFTNATDVAAKIVQAVETRQPTVTIGAGNRLLRWAGLYGGGLVDMILMRSRRR